MAANRKASSKVTSPAVLPPVTAAAGKKPHARAIRRAGELLPKEEREALARDLGRLAKIRRDAEAGSATLRLS